MDVGTWLRELGLGRYEQVFSDNDVDASILSSLTADDLKDLGVTSVGHRRRLLDAIATLGDAAAATPSLAMPPAEPARASGERRQLTVMFCDLVGSTEMSGRFDPEEMRDVIHGYQNAVAGQVTRFQGHVAKYMGDGVLAYFGWPEAHEDDAERATRAGLSILRRMGDLKTPAGEPLDARVGIATGLVVVGDLIGEGAAQEEAVVGETPNLAARLQGIAAPGELVISVATRRLLGDLFELRDLGPQTLKGIAAPTPAFAVLREGVIESRFEARQAGTLLAMVGRDQELALLMERWRRAKAGEGQLVLLTGEAGIGKSRITRAAIDEISTDEHIRINYQCSPYHSDSPFYPVTQQLSRAARFAADDGPAVKLDKLEALLTLSTRDVGEVAPLLASLLGIDAEGRYGKLDLSPPQQRSRTLRVLADQVSGLSRSQPVLFVVEDAHWIDPTTLELIELVIDQITAEPVLILVTARPTFEHGFASHPIVTRLALNRLGHQQVAAIITRLTEGKALPSELVEEIAAKTDGVPLFVEELTKNVLESGMLRQTEDAFLIEGSLADLSIPSSLHDSLMARLDRLQPVKEVAQTAACIGREFEHRLIAAVSPLSETNLQDALDRLIAAELVFRRGAPPDARYTFKHALVRDAAYESLLKGRRQQFHTRLLGVLENDTDKVSPEVLAHHATAAGLMEKAIDYWQAAGEGALARPAYEEAMGHFGNAINLIGDPVDDRKSQVRKLRLLTQLGLASTSSRGHSHPATADIFETACRLADTVRDAALTFPCLYGAWTVHFVTPHHDVALRRARQLMEIAPSVGEQAYEFVARRLLAVSQLMLGALSEARENHDRAMAIHDPERDSALVKVVGQDQSIGVRAYFALNLWCLGYPEQAWTMADDSLTRSRNTTHTNSRAYGFLHHLVFLALVAPHPAKATELCQDLVQTATEHGMAMWRDLALFFDGNLQLSGKDQGAAMTRLRSARASVAARNVRLFRPFLDADCARKLAALGRVEDAREFVTAAKTTMAASKERWAEAEVHRVDGLVHLAEGHPDETEAAFQQAIEIAEAQHAKSWELRAATRLARLWGEQGERGKAHDLLSPIHAWFTEGFDTPDLRDAGRLLDELS